MSHCGRRMILMALGILLGTGMLQAEVKWELDLEGGAAFLGSADVQSPNTDTATRFSLTDDLDPEIQAYFRARFGFTVNERHTISFLFAPLAFNSTGTLDFPVHFEETLFPQGTRVDALYQFNSYRATYRYNFVRTDKTVFGLGGTVKVRDAVIRLRGDGMSAANTDVGVVPLINVYLKRHFTENTGFTIEADALAAPAGRAEDVLIAFFARIHPRVTLKAGYRFLEGGADVDDVYNFSWIHYATAGLIFTF